MAKLPQELQGFVKYLQALPQKGSPALVALPPPEPPAPEPPTVPVALEERLRSLELQVSSLRDDFQKSLDEALGPVQRLSTSAADAVASLRQLVPVSLPRDLKDLREATKKLDTDMAAAQDLLNRLQRRLDEEVSATRKASVSLEEKLEELSARLKESRKDAPGQGSRQLKRQDSLLVVQDQCSQLSTRMGKLEEMVAAQNKQLVVQGDEQREVQQRLLEVRKEALEGLAQAFSLQEGGLPMTPPDQHRAVSGSEIRTRQSSSSLQDRPAPRTSGARRGGAAPQALKWPTGPLRTR